MFSKLYFYSYLTFLKCNILGNFFKMHQISMHDIWYKQKCHIRQYKIGALAVCDSVPRIILTVGSLPNVG